MTHTEQQGLVWDTEGYYTFGNDGWKDIMIIAKLQYTEGSIGIIPRFDSELSYVLFKVGNDTREGSSTDPSVTTATASLDAYIGSQVIHIGEKELTSPLTADSEYVIKATVTRTNYKIYLNDALVFNVEYGGLNNGMGGVFATPNNVCSEIEVTGDVASEWTSNVDEVSGAQVGIAELQNKDKYLYIDNGSDEEVFAKQVIEKDVEDDTYAYSLSYEANGECTVTISQLDGADMTSETFTVNNTDWSRNTHTIDIAADCTQVEVKYTVAAGKSLSVNDVQLEKSDFSTTYIHNEDTINTRGSSFITYPSKNNINSDLGGLSLWVKPSVDGDSGALFVYGDDEDSISIRYEEDSIAFQYGSQTMLYGTGFLKDTWYHIAAGWRSDQLVLYVNGFRTQQNGLYEFDGHSDLIRIGHDVSGQTFNGVIDDVIVFSKDITDDYVTAIYNSTDPIPNDDQMILRATFDHAIGNFNKSVIEMSPAPQYGSPVIVEKEDGTTMRKVSFFDKYTGEYQTHNTEEVIYDGVSDYIKVAYTNLDTDNYKIVVRDYVGAQYGDPYRVEGNRIYLTLPDGLKAKMKGKKLWVTYQPENAYTVDFNIGQPDSFRTTIGKYDGQPLTVSYEGNRFSNEKLADMIELNPLLNPNHQGFLYITKNTELTSVFRAKASPSDLPADGVAEAVVVIEPLDSNGNFISNAKLEVVTELTNSSIIPSYDPGSILVRERAGRYLYRYRAPLMYFRDHNRRQITDYINIRDKKSGVGVQIPVNLVLDDVYANADAAPSLEESNWEMVASRLLDVVMDYFGKSAQEVPNGLRQILDFDEDGMININEIIWLNNYKYTQTLYNKYVDYLSWKALNE